MGHQIITPYDIVLSTENPEWHGLAEVVPAIDHKTAERLLFPIIEATPSYSFIDPRTGKNRTIKGGSREDGGTGRKMLLADITHRASEPDFEGFKENEFFPELEVHGEGYKTVDNRAMFEMVMEAFKETGAKITSIGTLDKLRKFFISVDIGSCEMKLKNGDKLQNFVNLTTSHDGTYPIDVADSCIRIVCMNTFRASLMAQGDFGIRMQHTKNVMDRLDGIPDMMAEMLKLRKQLKQSLNYLLTVEMSPTQAAYLAAGYFANPFNLPNGKRAETLSTQGYNKAGLVRDLSVSGTGNGNKGKTLYDAFNGFTDLLTNGDATAGKKADNARRMSAARFGEAAEHKTRFFDLCMDDELRHQVLAYGEKLFRDKEQAMAA